MITESKYFLSDFLEIQRNSFYELLKKGLIKEFLLKNPISDSLFEIFFYPEHYRLSRPIWTIKECLLKEKTFSSKLYIPVQFTHKKNKEILLKWVYVGELPIMTNRGYFIFNGAPRVIVNQLIRSPGLYYQEKKINLYANHKDDQPFAVLKRFYADFICLRGTWLRIEIDKEKNIWAQFKKTVKIPLLWFLLAMGISQSMIFKSLSYPLRLLTNFEKEPEYFQLNSESNLKTTKEFKEYKKFVTTPIKAWIKMSELLKLQRDPPLRVQNLRNTLNSDKESSAIKVSLLKNDSEEVFNPSIFDFSKNHKISLKKKKQLQNAKINILHNISQNRIFSEKKIFFYENKEIAIVFCNKQQKPFCEIKRLNFQTQKIYFFSCLFAPNFKITSKFFMNSEIKKSDKLVEIIENTKLNRFYLAKKNQITTPIFYFTTKGKNILKKKIFLKPQLRKRLETQFMSNKLITRSELNTEELGRKWIYNKFMNSRNYDLGKQGRDSLNRKLRLNISQLQTTLTAKDVLYATDYLLKVEKGVKNVDDIDNLMNRKIRTSGELIQMQIALSLVRLEKTIREKFKNLGIKKNKKFISDLENKKIEKKNLQTFKSFKKVSKKFNTKKVRINDFSYNNLQLLYQFIRKNKKKQLKEFTHSLINPKIFNTTLREFFGTNPLSQFMDQMNPLAEITHKRRLSSMGTGGVGRENAPMAIRSIHPTHYGRICPIETPEGKNTGLVNSLTTYAQITLNGFIETPFYKVYKGQIQKTLGVFYLNTEQEEKLNSAPADLNISNVGFLPTSKIPARVATEFTKINRNDVQYIGVSPVQMISVATSLIPFLEHDDANRALMGSNMQRQAVPIIKSERPIVGTGFEGRTASDSGHVVQTTKSGLVVYVSSQQIIIYANVS